MSPTEPARKTGFILEVLPSSLYRVRIDEGGQAGVGMGSGSGVSSGTGSGTEMVTVLATPTRAATQRWTRFKPGDRVVIAISPFDPTRGRIESRE